MPLIDSIRNATPYIARFEPGMYELIYSFTAPDYDPQIMFFDWHGQRTGPWDYAPSGPRNGDCLLPHVRFTATPGCEVQARVFIPRREELDRRFFNGRVGFRVTEPMELALRLDASEKVVWQDARIEPVNEFLDTNVQAAEIRTGIRFFLNDEKLAVLRENWNKAPWCRMLDGILDDCGAFSPPATLADARRVATVYLKTETVYEDDVVFWGDYLAALSLRALVLEREEDLRQLERWTDALIELPVWGGSDDPKGRDHNNDLTADFHMFGLVIALNWHGRRLSQERADRIRRKIAYQAGEMRKWIIGARSSWPGVKTQNHAYYGFQTLLLGALALLDDPDPDVAGQALDDLRIAVMHVRMFAENLPTDGTYHEGLGYVSFGLLGLLPSLFLLEQVTGKPWIPHAWLRAHYLAMNAFLPDTPGEGFSIDDGDLLLPCNAPFALWAWRNAPQAETRAAAGEILRKLQSCPDRICLEAKTVGGNFWRLTLAPEVTDPEAELPQLQSRREAFTHLPSADACIFHLNPDRQAYFLAAPPHGHEQFGKEWHTYGYGHHHPDTGNVLLVDRGRWVLADTGYTYRKSTGEHNVLLVNGQGQHNDLYVWMPPPPWDIRPTRMRVTECDGAVHAETELAYIYPRALGLTRWARTVCGSAEGLVVADEMTADHASRFTLSWGSDFEWQATSGNAWRNASGWTLTVFAEDLSITAESVLPARRKWECNHPWHVLRLGNATPSSTYRIVSVFLPPEIRETAAALAQRADTARPDAGRRSGRPGKGR